MAAPKVFVCGCYGDYNLGDEAMLAGLLKVLQPLVPKSQITAFSKTPDDTLNRHKLNTFPSPSPQRKLQAWWKTIENLPLALCQHSHFILGGGDLLRDSTDYEVVGFWLRPLEQALKLRRKTAVVGISVGELWRPASLSKIPQILNHVDLIAVRDLASREKLHSLGVKNAIHIIPDLALNFWPLQDSSPNPSQSSQTSPQIGIAPRRIVGRGQSLQTFDTDLYFRQLAKSINTLIEQCNANIHLLPFSTPPYTYSYEDDYVACLELARYIKYPDNLKIYRYIPSFQALEDILRSLDLVIGMRLHSIILAAALGISVIALSYDPKVKNFMDEISLHENSINIDNSLDFPLINQVLKVLENREIYAELVGKGIKVYRKKHEDLYGNLELFLKN